MNTPWNLPIEDLDQAINVSSDDLEHWRDSRILVTGGTGVLGSWIVGSLVFANDRLGLGLRLSLVSRDPKNVPIRGREDVAVIEGDIRALTIKEDFDLIIHGAAGSSTNYGLGDAEPRVMAATIIDGTWRILECAARNRARLLFLSSGAVYGPQITPVAEQSNTGPDPLDPRSAYGEAKRVAENLCASATKAGEVEAVIARLFASVGPRLPLDSYFAAGNFLGDVLARRPIRVQGDGRPRRSYLYMGDIPEWCLAIATRGSFGSAYNVGSPEALTIAELAHKIAALAPNAGLPVEIAVAEQDGPAPWYVPITSKALSELGLEPRIGIDEALSKSFSWFSAIND